MGKEEKFFEMCTTLPFEEIKDDRDESSIPELARITEMYEAGNAQDAINYGKSLMKMYPDNDLIPLMLAYIYYQRHFPNEALQVAVEAIPKCKRKYRLYAIAGLAEFEKDRLPEALVWWSRSIVAQCKVTDFQEYNPFLHVAHCAEIIGAGRYADTFFSMADAIEPSGDRLSDADLNKLAPLKKSWAKKAFIKVIKHIDQNYLHT